jgi:capsid protein
MSLRDIRGWLAEKVKGHYEAAVRYTRDRGWIRGWVQDARFDASSATRYELVRKSRHFERNNGIAIRMSEVFAQFTVGAHGIVFAPSSSDPAWNSAASESLKRWGRFADIASRQTFGALQAICAHRLFFDGEVFVVKKFEKVGNRIFPRLHLLETQRVATPPDMWGKDDVNIHDGIEVDSNGRPIAYYFKDEFSGDKYKRYDASNVFHIFDQDRPGQLRGLPFLTPVMNELADLEELEKLTMRVAKKAASIAAIFKMRSGQLPASQTRQARLTTTQTLNTGDSVEKERIQTMSDTYGGDLLALFPEEDIKQPEANTPNVAQREHWDYLVSKVCTIGIPKLLVFPHSMQGTVARADLDVADAWFKARSATLVDAFERIVLWVLDWEAFTDSTLSPKPKDWWKMSSRPPRSVNVDVGRNSDALIREIEAGIKTFEGAIAPLGEDWREFTEQRAQEAKWFQELSDKYQVPISSLTKFVTKSMAAGPGDVQAQALNGAQLSALQLVLSSVSLNQLAPEAAKILIQTALPLSNPQTIATMVDEAAAFDPAVIAPPNQQGQQQAPSAPVEEVDKEAKEQ